MSEYYSNAKPNLIGPRIEKTVYTLKKMEVNNNSISDKVVHFISTFYDDYIKQNKLVTFIIISIIAFLSYRYVNRVQKEKFNNNEQHIIDEIMNKQTQHLANDDQAHFDRLIAVNNQQQPVNYLPGGLPINLPNQGIVQRQAIKPYPQQYAGQGTDVPSFNPNYNNVQTAKSRSHYAGTHNTYQNTPHNDAVNPLGFSTQFNKTTGNFVGSMTNKNKQNAIDYNAILNNVNKNLRNGLKPGVRPDFSKSPNM